jgi:hypothetical protein
MTDTEPSSELPTPDGAFCQAYDEPWIWGDELNNPLDDETVSRAWMRRPRVGQLVHSRKSVEDSFQPLGRIVRVDKSIATHKRHTDGSEDCFIWCHREDVSPGFSLNTLHTWNGPPREGVAPINNLARYLQAVALVADLRDETLLTVLGAQLLTTLEALVQEARPFVQHDGHNMSVGFSWASDQLFYQYQLQRMENLVAKPVTGLSVWATDPNSARLCLQQFSPVTLQADTPYVEDKRDSSVIWFVVQLGEQGITFADGADRCTKDVRDM